MAQTTVVLELTTKEAEFLASFLLQGVEWAHEAGDIAEGIYNALADDAGVKEGDFEFSVRGHWLRAEAA